MDSGEPPTPTASEFRFHLGPLRFVLIPVFSIPRVLAFVVLAVLLSFPFGNFSIGSPVSLPSQCRIVSSSVDLRSSKVCELGLLNFKAKRVFYPSERKKFRCHYDYYWASIFKVEYNDHFSGQMLHGSAEAPKEALPHDCRPSFGMALVTRHKFKVNESYDCWYTSGLSKVDIYGDNYFGCQVKDPSSIEMIRRYLILSTRMLHSWLSSRDIASGMGWGMIAGAASGFFTSLVSVGLFKMLQSLLLWSPRVWGAVLVSLVRRILLSRVFFLLAYFSVVGWLAIQYGTKLGIPISFADY